MPIQPTDVFVVVQGPVVGGPDDPSEYQLTQLTVESVRRLLPGAKICLSTWKDSDAKWVDHDVYVESVDPGAASYWKSYPVAYNVNRQITSTLAGLAAADRPFALKLRSDLVLTHTGFLRLFQRFPKRADTWRVFGRRLVISGWPSWHPRRSHMPFAPSDWVTFGRTEDVLKMWDVPPASDTEISRYFEVHPRPHVDKQPELLCRYIAEQYLWLSCLRKQGSVPCEHVWDLGPHNLPLSELTLANNLIVAEPHRFGIEFRKYDFRRWGIYYFYTHAEWQALYRTYCDPQFSMDWVDRLRLLRDQCTLDLRRLFAGGGRRARQFIFKNHS